MIPEADRPDNSGQYQIGEDFFEQETAYRHDLTSRNYLNEQFIVDNIERVYTGERRLYHIDAQRWIEKE